MPRRSRHEIVSVTIRCNIPPADSAGGYSLGERFARDFLSGTRVQDVIESLAIAPPLVGIVLVNKQLLRDWTGVLCDGDHIDIFPLVRGG